MKTLETVHATVEKINLYYNLIFWNLLNTLIFCSCFLFAIFFLFSIKTLLQEFQPLKHLTDFVL